MDETENQTQLRNAYKELMEYWKSISLQLHILDSKIISLLEEGINEIKDG